MKNAFTDDVFVPPASYMFRGSRTRKQSVIRKLPDCLILQLLMKVDVSDQHFWNY